MNKSETEQMQQSDRLARRLRVLIAMDESTLSLAAVDAVLTSMHPNNSHILLLHVLEAPALLEPDQSVWGREEQATRFLRDVSRRLQSADFKDVETRVVEGEAPGKILEIAGEWDADFIVLGSHSRTGLDRILLGSVAESVARQASSSIMIVRKPIRSASPR